MTTTNITLPAKLIPWAIIRDGVTTERGSFTLGFDNGYVVNNGKRYKIGSRNGYEFIRKTRRGERQYFSTKVLLARYEQAQT